MRLHRRLVRTSPAGKKFYRYDLALPAKLLKDLDWTEKTDLTIEAHGDILIIRRT